MLQTTHACVCTKSMNASQERTAWSPQFMNCDGVSYSSSHRVPTAFTRALMHSPLHSPGQNCCTQWPVPHLLTLPPRRAHLTTHRCTCPRGYVHRQPFIPAPCASPAHPECTCRQHLSLIPYTLHLHTQPIIPAHNCNTHSLWHNVHPHWLWRVQYGGTAACSVRLSTQSYSAGK